MPQAMSPNEIRAELIRRGIAVKEIARQAGVTPEAVSQVISGKYPYKGYRIRPYIARALGLAVEDIWPEATDDEAGGMAGAR